VFSFRRSEKITSAGKAFSTPASAEVKRALVSGWLQWMSPSCRASLFKDHNPVSLLNDISGTGCVNIFDMFQFEREY
jgi:hypothetical protein